MFVLLVFFMLCFALTLDWPFTYTIPSISMCHVSVRRAQQFRDVALGLSFLTVFCLWLYLRRNWIKTLLCGCCDSSAAASCALFGLSRGFFVRSQVMFTLWPSCQVVAVFNSATRRLCDWLVTTPETSGAVNNSVIVLRVLPYCYVLQQWKLISIVTHALIGQQSELSMFP